MPRNTVTEQIYHIPKKILIDSHPYLLLAMKLPFLPSLRTMRKCRVGKQNFTQVLPWHEQTIAAFPMHLNFLRCPHCSVQLVLGDFLCLAPPTLLSCSGRRFGTKRDVTSFIKQVFHSLFGLFRGAYLINAYAFELLQVVSHPFCMLYVFT